MTWPLLNQSVLLAGSSWWQRYQVNCQSKRNRVGANHQSSNQWQVHAIAVPLLHPKTKAQQKHKALNDMFLGWNPSLVWKICSVVPHPIIIDKRQKHGQDWLHICTRQGCNSSMEIDTMWLSPIYQGVCNQQNWQQKLMTTSLLFSG